MLIRNWLSLAVHRKADDWEGVGTYVAQRILVVTEGRWMWTIAVWTLEDCATYFISAVGLSLGQRRGTLEADEPQLSRWPP